MFFYWISFCAAERVVPYPIYYYYGHLNVVFPTLVYAYEICLTVAFIYFNKFESVQVTTRLNPYGIRTL